MKLLKQTRIALPLILFMLIVALLWRGLSLHPTHVPSPFINKPAPAFKLHNLFHPKEYVTNHDFIGQVTLLNVWATWCSACASEHEFLLHLAKNEHVIIDGLDYKDDVLTAKEMLKNSGNPYYVVALDLVGDVGIDYGVYGAPETFIIDKKGIIRYKQIGPITPEIWDKELRPLVQQLQSEAP